MNEDQFDKELDAMFNQQAPTPDDTRKSAVIKQSKAEFSQAFAKASRLNKEGANHHDSSIVKSLWRFLMSPIQNPMPYKAFATAGVALFALSLVIYLPRPGDEQIVIHAPEPTVVEHDKQSASKDKKSIPPGFAERVDVVKATGPIESSKPIVADAVAADQELALMNRESEIKAAKELPLRKEESEASHGERQRRKTEAELIARSRVMAENTAPHLAPVAQSAPAAKSSPMDYAPVAGLSLPDQVFSEPTARPDSGEGYAEYKANPIIQVSDKPVSTFSVDVDTASYSLVRNQLNQGYLPKPQAVRAEELINYFDYDYVLPSNKLQPFKPSISVLDSPWNEGRKLVHIGIKGYDIATTEQPDTNLVFLLDVSGSMNQANKLPLVKQSLGLLLDSMKPTDTVSIAVYAGAAGVVLEPTQAREKSKILQSLQNLRAGGSTAGGQGIRLAYQLAQQNFKKDAVNRIILATDGDFNVGQSSNEDLKTLVERKRDQGVFLSVLGFGRNNYQDDMMQTLAQNGNGVAAYIDTLSEAKKVLVDEASSTLFPIAKDVKIQVEFNPAKVSDYRLVGYETRALSREDFNNDKVDAGDIGAGHTVTAIYEITPTDSNSKSVDPLRYSGSKAAISSNETGEYGFLKIRYKLPKENKSRLIEAPINEGLKQSSTEAEFSIAVAGFAQLLANSQHTGELDFDAVIKLASANKGKDEFGYRTEFVQLVRMAKIAKP